MSSIFHLRTIEFAILFIAKCHYILWSRPFKIANSKVNNRYIIVLPEFFGKNANLRLELNIQDYGNKSIGS